jgi:ribosomal protein S18 acetylase RimI-like enzyme
MKEQAEFDLIRAHEAVFFEIYAEVRGEELKMQDWAPEFRAATLRIQFEAQARGYREQFPGAEECLILRAGSPIGWLIVDRSGPALHCIDIAIVPGERSKGIGTQVFRALQEEAASKGGPVVLTVRPANSRALALYLRLGFRVIRQDDLHTIMEWRR